MKIYYSNDSFDSKVETKRPIRAGDIVLSRSGEMRSIGISLKSSADYLLIEMEDFELQALKNALK